MADGDGRSRRRKAYRRGLLSEYVAAFFLMLKGYRILSVRYRTKVGEIDIIARKADLVVFVEVKARSDAGAAIDAVGYGAQRRIRSASDIWMSRQPDCARLSWRYDIVAVVPWRLPRHLQDAF
ncbi:YraN family protein [Rhizobium sp. NRK18]|uniref:YraN family protein n=1 Tax=Rhizobium sp. NRK18 TaxID=2964667 RepID=UPI0021C457CB|nr:YraN family protein [Rhizobium sp. NRK18]MCQ2005620.1 YraN family protein [Rhizobium sp. NRK18]